LKSGICEGLKTLSEECHTSYSAVEEVVAREV
jgi:hypothetical protein